MQFLTGTNTYTGATTINGGALSIGNGGTTGSLAAGSQITFGAGTTNTLAFNRSDATTAAPLAIGNSMLLTGRATSLCQ